MKNALLFALAFVSFASFGQTGGFLSDYMERNRLDGTMIIESLDGATRYVWNAARAEIPYLPASTFKVVNTLIALQEGAVKNEDETIGWDGKDKGLADWNGDQSVSTAFPSSCVWFYQELARRIGNERYLQWLEELGYGNGKTGRNVDTFWLEGDLRISGREQIGVMRNIVLEKYPFGKGCYDVLRRVMVVRRTESGAVVRAKTGWVSRVSPQIGWYVGYVEAKGDVWLFALNYVIGKPSEASYREKIAFEAFEELGLLD